MTTVADPLVTLQHVRARGYRERADGKTWCASGIRAWCERHGIDYLELVHQGIPASRMEATDGWGELVAQDARDEAGANDGRE